MQITRQPAYREAYPVVGIFELLRAWRARAALCRFTAGCTPLGDLLVTRVTDEWILVVYSCVLADPAWTPTPDLFRLVRKPNGVDRSRVYFACPGCKKARATLLLRGRWKCASCHRLSYRQQKLDKWTVAWERRRSLEAQIGPGRPPYMRHAEYRALLSALEELRTMPRHTEAYANSAYQQLVESRWLSVSDAGDSIGSDYIFVGDRYVERPPTPDPAPAPPAPPAAPEKVVRASPFLEDHFFDFDDDPDAITEL